MNPLDIGFLLLYWFYYKWRLVDEEVRKWGIIGDEIREINCRKGARKWMNTEGIEQEKKESEEFIWHLFLFFSFSFISNFVSWRSTVSTVPSGGGRIILTGTIHHCHRIVVTGSAEQNRTGRRHWRHTQISELIDFIAPAVDTHWCRRRRRRRRQWEIRAYVCRAKPKKRGKNSLSNSS